jgi:flagellar biogenesis protein FliO
VLSQFARAFTWAHAKYASSGAKRLRLSEVVSLGDKRFVALVSVEGREFLIGGAPSGLSLLAQLGGSTENADVRPQGMSAEVRAR